MLDGHRILFDFQASVEEGIPGPESLLSLNLFRIYKEGLTNVIKHSRATEVKITLTIIQNQLALSIHDDGKGFDRVTERGKGIHNMKTRAKELGGDLEILADKGTHLLLKVPLPIKYPALGMD